MAVATKHGFADIRLRTRDPHSLGSFYSDILNFTLVEHLASSLTVQAGSTRLVFEQDPRTDPAPYYHFAFNISENKIEEARKWLAARVELIRGENGDLFHFPNWNAHAIYYYDPAGNIGEFIARHDLPSAREGEFSIADVDNVSELGLVVENLPTTVEQIRSKLRLPVYGPSTSEFCALGDPHQLLIVVSRGRRWAADYKHTAMIFPTRATLTGPDWGSWENDVWQYRLHMEGR